MSLDHKSLTTNSETVLHFVGQEEKQTLRTVDLFVISSMLHLASCLNSSLFVSVNPPN